MTDFTQIDDVFPDMTATFEPTPTTTPQNTITPTPSQDTSPGWLKELRSIKVGDFVLFDTIGSFAIAYLLKSKLVPEFFVNENQMYYSIIPISILAHYLVGQHTPISDHVLYAPQLNAYHGLVAICILGMIYESRR